MAVLACAGCSRWISISNVPGGNPVALLDPDTWSVDYGVCGTCEPKGLFQPHFCDRCIAESTKCPHCGSDLKVFRLSREVGRSRERPADFEVLGVGNSDSFARKPEPPERPPDSGIHGPTPLAVLAKTHLPSVLEAVRRSAPCPVDWLAPARREAVGAVVVAVDCADVDLASTFAPLEELARNGVPIIAGLLYNAVDAELSDLVEMEMREHFNLYGYPGDHLPILRLEEAGNLKRIIRKS